MEPAPVIHPWADGLYARLLASVLSMTDVEPAETFAATAVQTLGRRLSRKLDRRLGEAPLRPHEHGSGLAGSRADEPGPAGLNPLGGATCHCGNARYELIDYDLPGQVTLDSRGRVTGFHGTPICTSCGTPWQAVRDRLSIVPDRP